ncbi:hypothetical protein B0F90DRAFT_1768628, partial [Multifurca ochricompacta]
EMAQKPHAVVYSGLRRGEGGGTCKTMADAVTGLVLPHRPCHLIPLTGWGRGDGKSRAHLESPRPPFGKRFYKEVIAWKDGDAVDKHTMEEGVTRNISGTPWNYGAPHPLPRLQFTISVARSALVSCPTSVNNRWLVCITPNSRHEARTTWPLLPNRCHDCGCLVSLRTSSRIFYPSSSNCCTLSSGSPI